MSNGGDEEDRSNQIWRLTEPHAFKWGSDTLCDVSSQDFRFPKFKNTMLLSILIGMLFLQIMYKHMLKLQLKTIKIV